VRTVFKSVNPYPLTATAALTSPTPFHLALAIWFLSLLCLAVFAAAAQGAALPEPDTGIEGLITISPTHGGPARAGIPDSKPLANATFVVENETGLVASFVTDGEGQFRVSVAPGHYSVSLKEKKPKVGRYGPFEVDVVTGHVTKVVWACDSGMR